MPVARCGDCEIAYKMLNCSSGSVQSSAGCRYAAGVSSWRTPGSLQRGTFLFSPILVVCVNFVLSFLTSIVSIVVRKVRTAFNFDL